MNWQEPKVRIKTGLYLVIMASLITLADLFSDFTANGGLVSTMFITGGSMMSAGLVNFKRDVRNGNTN